MMGESGIPHVPVGWISVKAAHIDGSRGRGMRVTLFPALAFGDRDRARQELEPPRRTGLNPLREGVVQLKAGLDRLGVKFAFPDGDHLSSDPFRIGVCVRHLDRSVDPLTRFWNMSATRLVFPVPGPEAELRAINGEG